MNSLVERQVAAFEAGGIGVLRIEGDEGRASIDEKLHRRAVDLGCDNDMAEGIGAVDELIGDRRPEDPDALGRGGGLAARRWPRTRRLIGGYP